MEIEAKGTEETKRKEKNDLDFEYSLSHGRYLNWTTVKLDIVVSLFILFSVILSFFVTNLMIEDFFPTHKLF